MPILSSSPALRPSRARAPEPSAALLALQERGLELPVNCRASVSPQSDPAYNASPWVSPLSIPSTASNLEDPPSLEPGDRWNERPSSTSSTEISRILNLYTNHSEHSLRSKYTEMPPYPGNSEEDHLPALLDVHQPKAYRDTIAPLLEHQFSTERLAMPPMPSPISIASLPRLHHPNASASLPSLQSAPEISPGTRPATSKLARISQTSIQITPEMTPPNPLPDSSRATSFRQYSASLRERRIALEVPDVREADSWYDQPLEELEDRSRDSQLSAVSPFGAVGFHRRSAYESLAPLTGRISPNIGLVGHVEDYLPGPVSATLHNSMLPPPLDLTRSTSKAVRKISEGSAPVHQPEISSENFENELKSQHASLMVDDPIEGPMRTYLMPPPLEKVSEISSAVLKEKSDLEGLHQPGLAFSDGSSDPPNPDTTGGQFKVMFKFRKIKDDSSKDASSGKGKTNSGHLPTNASCATHQDSLESYKYSYWKSYQSESLSSTPRLHSIQLPDMNNIQSSCPDAQGTWRLPVMSGPGPSISGSSQLQEPPIDRNTIGRASRLPLIKRREPQPAIPLTNYQKYGVEIWDEKAKKKRQKEAEKAAKRAEKAAAKQAKTGMVHGHQMSPDAQLRDFIDNHISNSNSNKSQPASQEHSRLASSRAYSHMKTTSGDTDASDLLTDAASITSRRQNGGLVGYNNDLFEASGGAKKKSRFASRLMMSSEDKRKLKVKESITIVGGQRLGSCHTAQGGRASEEGTKGLVKI